MKRGPHTVLLVLSEAGVGGMQAVVGLLAAGLAERGLEIHIASGGGGAMPEVLSAAVAEHESVHEHRLPLPHGARGQLAFAAALRGLRRALRPDVVHGHGLRTSAPLALVSGRLPRRILVSCHGLPPADLARSARHVRLTGVTVAAVGIGLQAALRAQHIAARLLPNGITPAPPAADRAAIACEFGLPVDKPLIVCPARLSPQKDPVTLVRAVSLVPDASLLLIGGGPLESEVRDVVEELGITDRVAVTGWRNDARALLGAADLLAMSARWEAAVPIAMLEAAAAGVPMVATACPGVTDWINESSTTSLSPVGDAAALGRSIDLGLHDEALRAGLLQSAQQLGQQHSLAQMVETHLDLYAELMA